MRALTDRKTTKSSLLNNSQNNQTDATKCIFSLLRKAMRSIKSPEIGPEFSSYNNKNAKPFLVHTTPFGIH